MKYTSFDEISNVQISNKEVSLFQKLEFSSLVCSFILVVIWGILTFVHPSASYIPFSDSLSNFPYVDNSFYDLLFFGGGCLGLVWIIFFIFSYMKKRCNFYGKYFNNFLTFRVFWTHIMIIAFSNIVVIVMGNYLGRARPDYYARCGVNTNPNQCKVLGKRELDDELRSFPSFYSATGMSSFLFLSSFLQKVIKRKEMIISCLCLTPVLLACFAGCTGIKWHKHHTDDVVGGFILGALTEQFIWKGSAKRIFTKDN